MGAIATQIILMLHEADCLCDTAEGLGTNNTILLGPVQFPAQSLAAHGCKPHLTGHGCRTHPFPKECPLTWTMAQDHSLKSYKAITMGSLQHWNKNRGCLGSPWCDQHCLGCSYVFGRSRNLHSPHQAFPQAGKVGLPQDTMLPGSMTGKHRAWFDNNSNGLSYTSWNVWTSIPGILKERISGCKPIVIKTPPPFFNPLNKRC